MASVKDTETWSGKKKSITLRHKRLAANTSVPFALHRLHKLCVITPWTVVV